MRTTTTKRRTPAKTNPTTTAAVERTVDAVVAQAERDLAGAYAVLKVLGIVDGSGRCIAPVPLDLMLKLGAMMRIYQWQEADLIQFLHAELPSAEGVLRDTLNNPRGGGEYGGHELTRQMFTTWFRQMAFARVEPQADVVINRINAEAVVAQLAEFLWRHRRLAATNQEK